jgi:anti-sigma regulatory factor (Ser/Thr protein kinase)
LDEPLPHPPAAAETLRFTDIDAVRRFVRAHAAAAKLSTSAVADAVLAVDEVGTNALRHGGDHGHLAIWRRGDVLVCQVDGGGQITDPLVGRRRPDDTQIGGRGLWIVNQLCRLVQIRSSPRGSTVRLHLGDSADRP